MPWCHRTLGTGLLYGEVHLIITLTKSSFSRGRPHTEVPGLGATHSCRETFPKASNCPSRLHPRPVVMYTTSLDLSWNDDFPSHHTPLEEQGSTQPTYLSHNKNQQRNHLIFDAELSIPCHKTAST